jgi:hypothetical protein
MASKDGSAAATRRQMARTRDSRGCVDSWEMDSKGEVMTLSGVGWLTADGTGGPDAAPAGSEGSSAVYLERGCLERGPQSSAAE